MSRPKILIVEDKRVTAEHLRSALTGMGYEAEWILPTAEEAITKAEEVRPDLILMDIMLAGPMDGIEAAEIIRTNLDIPVVYLTAYSNQEIVQRAVATEPFGYLLKPFRTEEIKTTVEAALFKHAMERRLRSSEQRLELALKGGDLGTWEINLKTGEAAHDQRAVEMFGYSPEEIAPSFSAWEGLLHPDDVESVRKALKSHLKGDLPVLEIEHRIRHKSGEWRWCLARGGAVERDGEGKALRIMGTNMDITDRKRTEEAMQQAHDELESRVQERTSELVTTNRRLKEEIVKRTKAEKALAESEQRYRELADNTLDVIWQTDLDLRFTYVNPSIFQVMGYTPDEWIGTRLTEHCDEKNFMMMAQVASEEISKGPNSSGAIFEAVMLKKNKEPISVEIHGRVILGDKGLPIALQGVTRDITSRKKAEEALRESEERYRAVFHNAGIGIDLLNRDGKILQVNHALLDMLGYSEEAFHQLTFLDITHPEEKEISKRNLQALMAGEIEAYRLEKRYLRKDGSVLWGDLTTSAIRGAKGEHLGTIGVIADITERKLAEEALRESEEKYRTLFEDSPDPLFIVTADATIIDVNPAFLELFGYEKEEIVGHSVLKTYADPAHRQRYLQAFGDKGFVRDYPLRLLRKDGREIDCLVSSRSELDEDGNILGYRGFIRDITEQKDLQKQLLQAQKMEAIGTLAGGVAHDFNNILQVALGYSELILGDEGLPQRYRADVQKINESARRGADLVQRLLTFSRKTEIKLQPLSLNRRINEMRTMIERTIPKMIDVQLGLADDLATINADPTQIDQVLMNLSVNARDAMPDGGRLIVETANIILDEEYAKTHLDSKPGRYVVLMVTDTGAGMEKETLDHIFEPFYTTKGVGEGTGLGLAMVHGIVRQHGGHIRCYSELGHGTTFKIYFPALVSEEELKETVTRTMPKGGSETILLGDDEEMIRDLGSRILSKSGYKVIMASNGKEALDLYEQRGGEIALVVLDLIMPEMGGKQCLEGLLRLDPAVKVVIASGYSADGPTKEALAAGAKGFVNKPYDIRQVLEVVRGVLDAE